MGDGELRSRQIFKSLYQRTGTGKSGSKFSEDDDDQGPTERYGTTKEFGTCREASLREVSQE